jgi:mono/diheme cytochrome c family protein
MESEVRARARFLLGMITLTPACTLLPPLDLERMIDQDRFTTWQACGYFPDGRLLRPPPEGTVPRGAEIGSPAIVDGAYLAEVPLPRTRALLERGRARYDAYCAPCHGLRGDGQSVVALQMNLRRPPSLVDEAARALPPGRVYQVIDEGYGMMRAYSDDLVTAEERWSVVAYLDALRAAQGVPLDSLPPAARRAAREALP